MLDPEPPFPETLRYLWQWHQDIQIGVQGNGMTYPIIDWVTLEAWARLTRHQISPREASTIVTLSNIWAGIMSETRETKHAAGR